MNWKFCTLKFKFWEVMEIKQIFLEKNEDKLKYKRVF